MKIQLSDHFDYKRLLRFVAPSILMLLCTSIYSIVDGFFVSNFVGKTPFAALNLVMPVLMGVGTIGFMAGTGGSAVVSMTLGEGKKELANEYFSLIVYVTLAVSVVLGLIGYAFAPQIALALGANGDLEADCVLYSRILFLSTPAFVMQYLFQSFFIAAEKPTLSLKINVLAGLTNAVLDYVLIVVFPPGTGRSGAGNGGRTSCRRSNSDHLFCRKKQQFVTTWKDEMARKSHLADLYERFFRTGDESVDVHCRCAL